MISYLGESWIPWCVIVRLFEVQETSGNAMATCVFASVKNEAKILGFVFSTL